MILICENPLICGKIILFKNKKPPVLGGSYKLYFTYLYNTSPLLLNCNNADNSDNNVIKICHFLAD
jgi:hypothetical protein